MRHEVIHVEHEFRVPVERVFARLSPYDGLAPLLGMKVEQIAAGEHRPDGVGAVRRVKARGWAAFEETVTAFREHQLIEYEITKGGPFTSHHGALRFSRRESGHASHLAYEIEIASDIPFVVRIAAADLRRRLPRALAELDEELAALGGPGQTVTTKSGRRLGVVEPPEGSDVTIS